jgi:hypothetical protein
MVGESWLNKEMNKNSDDAFDSFLLTLSEQLGNLKKINQDIIEENVIHDDTETKTKKYLSFLEEFEAIQKTTELPSHNVDISNISTQINEELSKFKKQLGRMALEGGGGTNAVQYANGGYMNGDLVVSGNITALGGVFQDSDNLGNDISSLRSFIQSNSASWSGGGGVGDVKYVTDIVGNNVDTIFTFSHGLGTSDLIVSIIDTDTDKIVMATVRVDSTNIIVDFSEPFSNTYRLVALGAGQVGAPSGFNLTKITTPGNYTQINSYTHFVYDDDTAGSGINVQLLAIANHTGVKTHKKIGTTGTVTLNPPAGVLIDGAPVFVLNAQYQSVQLYTDGTNYLIQ